MTDNQDIWQQMVSGQWYQTQHPILVAARGRAKALCHTLNALPEMAFSERQPIIDQLLPNVTTVKIGADFGCDYGVNIHAGDGLVIGNRVVLLDPGIIRIGTNVTLGDNVVLASLTHPLEAARRKAGWQQTASITLGDNVTLGEGASVLPGASVPANTVISAGQLVTASTRFNVT